MAALPFQYLSQTLELADRGSIGQMLVNPAPYLFDRPAHGQGLRKSSFISLSFRLIIHALLVIFIIFPEAI